MKLLKFNKIQYGQNIAHMTFLVITGHGRQVAIRLNKADMDHLHHCRHSMGHVAAKVSHWLVTWGQLKFHRSQNFNHYPASLKPSVRRNKIHGCGD